MDGRVIFRNDVYGRDPPTLAALDRPLQPGR
jgi:murein L,D-transpeptidase YcbB/YkuD